MTPRRPKSEMPEGPSVPEQSGAGGPAPVAGPVSDAGPIAAPELPLDGGAAVEAVERAEREVAAVASAAAGPAEPAEVVPKKRRGRPRRLPDDVALKLDTLERKNAELVGTVAMLEAQRNETLIADVQRSCAGIVMLVGDVLAMRFGDHWTVTEGEAGKAGEHIGTAIMPFLGSFAKYMPLALAVGSLAGVFLPRLQVEREIREGKRPRIRGGQEVAE